MKLNLKKLFPDCNDRKYFEQINDEAFPPSEHMSMDEIFAFQADTNTDILGIYDNDTQVGFAVILKNDECGYVYFIAIDKKKRSKGYGKAAMEKIISDYPCLQIVLDFEEIDESAENNAQRIRRKNFYLQNGFHETGRYTLLSENRFEVVCSGEKLRENAFKDLLNILHAHRPKFPNVLI